MTSIKYVQKPFWGGEFYVCTKFSFVRSSHDLYGRAHAHILEGTLAATRWSRTNITFSRLCRYRV